MGDEINKVEEYKTLRDELRESKRYVFERPLLAVAAIFAAAQFVDKHQIAFLPLIATALLSFNFWFTVNRLRSSSRIVAYIQAVLENPKIKTLLGWETFLRFQRIWMKKNKDRLAKIIEDNIDKDAIPDALFYYPAIFIFHIALVILSCIASISFAYSNKSTGSYLLLVATISVAIHFFISSIKLRPSKLKCLIEEYRIIIVQVLKYIDEINSNDVGREKLPEKSGTDDINVPNTQCSGARPTDASITPSISSPAR